MRVRGQVVPRFVYGWTFEVANCWALACLLKLSRVEDLGSPTLQAPETVLCIPPSVEAEPSIAKDQVKGILVWPLNVAATRQNSYYVLRSEVMPNGVKVHQQDPAIEYAAEAVKTQYLDMPTCRRLNYVPHCSQRMGRDRGFPQRDKGVQDQGVRIEVQHSVELHEQFGKQEAAPHDRTELRGYGQAGQSIRVHDVVDQIHPAASGEVSHANLVLASQRAVVNKVHPKCSCRVVVGSRANDGGHPGKVGAVANDGHVDDIGLR